MNLVLVEPAELVDGVATLGGRRAKHVYEVHRAREGDTLRAGVVGGRVGEALVRRATPDAVELALTLDADPPPPLAIDLVVALPRPKFLLRVLQAASSLGVKRVVVVNAARVEKSFFGSPSLEPEAIREHCLLGLEQARDTVLPEVLVRERFRPFVEDEAPALWSGAKKLVAHPTAPRGNFPKLSGERAVVAIGPEGGWVPFEVELLAKAGFEPFTLGERILRVDVAVTYALAKLS